MDLLFLDFDGVLNNTGWFVRKAEARLVMTAQERLAKPYNELDDFDPENMARLKEIVDALPSLHVVISSAWRVGRRLPDLRALLSSAVPYERVVGVTPSDPSRLRHVEIRRFLDEWPRPVARWLALDDDTHDMHQLGANFLHVERERGLTPEHVRKTLCWFFHGKTP